MLSPRFMVQNYARVRCPRQRSRDAKHHLRVTDRRGIPAANEPVTDSSKCDRVEPAWALESEDLDTSLESLIATGKVRDGITQHPR